MIPQALTSADAQQLVSQGRARFYTPECLTTPRAVYAWDAATEHYTRRKDIASAVPASVRTPRPTSPVAVVRPIVAPVRRHARRRVPVWAIALAALSGPIGLPILLVYALVRERDCHACGDHDEAMRTADVRWSWRAYR
jgi:hypothetical protein